MTFCIRGNSDREYSFAVNAGNVQIGGKIVRAGCDAGRVSLLQHRTRQHLTLIIRRSYTLEGFENGAMGRGFAVNGLLTYSPPNLRSVDLIPPEPASGACGILHH